MLDYRPLDDLALTCAAVTLVVLVLPALFVLARLAWLFLTAIWQTLFHNSTYLP